MNIAVLFSGGGRTVLNLLDYIERGELDLNITLAIASVNEIVGIDRLVDRGLDVAVAREQSQDSQIGDENTNAWLEEARPNLICLCGYLRLLKIQPWMEGRVINIHPALLPKFGGKGMFGMHVHQAVINQEESVSGCTVHYVDSQYDHGEIILQQTCMVEQNDTAQSLAKKVFGLECAAYPAAIQEVALQLKV